ncbi:3-dehydrosphinganine reductase Ecym_6286 [Eremothecium cymbalariae DBVPG|uniref:3-ketodihydrosphingosine reductase TSC10 n=1 Tax=Eremothecium cymbalariae (strain CBS 270.75 / DBVPG 7215 / KCTC 17166 / NRRL Y-17582) TaxID=931890 RepID=G8JVI7_ERECY|nr:hypothetical protein Ecym_6286 [Eremothecium cymbalariae DBVPG\
MTTTKYKLNNQVVLISGGSQGLGKEYAKKFYRQSNSTVIIVSRSVANLKEAATEITGGKRFSKLNAYPKNSRLYYYACDLSNYEAVQELFTIIDQKAFELTQVLICAGGAVPKFFTDLTPEEIAGGVDTNYCTAAFLAHASLKHGAKHLVFISSSVALYPFIGYSQYAPAKVGIRSLVAILRQEQPDVRISCVYPGNFASEGFVQENRTKPDITTVIEGASRAISPEECCNKIIKSLQSGCDDITTDFVGWILLACTMGFNGHNTKYSLWPIGWLFGAIANLLIVPIYMLFCWYDIIKWRRRQQRAKEEAKAN